MKVPLGRSGAVGTGWLWVGLELCGPQPDPTLTQPALPKGQGAAPRGPRGCQAEGHGRECPFSISPEGSREGNGVTRATEEGPPAGAEGVSWTPALPEPHPMEGARVPVSPLTHPSQIPAAPWPSPLGGQAREARPGSPGRAFTGGQPPRAEGQRVPSVSDAALNLTSVLPNALLKCHARTDSSDPQHLGSPKERVFKLSLKNEYLKSPHGGTACQPAALSLSSLAQSCVWAAPGGSPCRFL